MRTVTNAASRSVARYRLFSRLLSSATGETIDHLLKEIVEVFDLEAAGLCWPVSGKAQLSTSSDNAGPDSDFRWDDEVLAKLAGAKSSNEFLTDPDCANRLFFPLVVEARRNGVFWATANDYASGDPEALVVVAQCLARHAAILERIGACHDPARIVQRLQDAAAVGGKIAHDLDNIFTGVVGFAEMTQSQLVPGTLLHQYIAEITSAGNRGIQFTQQLHQLSRSGVCRPMPTTVSPVLAREEVRLRKSLGDVRLQFPAPANLPATMIDAGALQMVLSHLLDNAIEASPAKGLVRVTTSLIELSDVEAREFLGAASAGPFVEICVSDEGPGIRDEHRKRLFVEPFFTTKVRHRGLGLSVIYRILHAHRGGIRFESESGRGTVFQVVLPLAAARNPESSTAAIQSN